MAEGPDTVSAAAPTTDLATRGAVHDLVVAFYRELIMDDVLAPVFVEVAEVDWAHHIPHLIDYWCQVLHGDPRYRGAIVAAHREIHDREAFRPEHFTSWYRLWESTIDDRWSGPLAEQAKAHAAKVAGSLSRHLTGEPWSP